MNLLSVGLIYIKEKTLVEIHPFSCNRMLLIGWLQNGFILVFNVFNFIIITSLD